MKWFYPYWGPLVVKTQTTEAFVNKLLEEGDKAKNMKQDNSSELAGVLDKQYYYKEFKEWFNPRFEPVITLYQSKLNEYLSPEHMQEQFGNKIPFNIEVKSLWINYQKQYEYQPIHKHTGDLSFVIYLQVPKEIEQEVKEKEGTHNNSGPGKINFTTGPHMPFSITTYDELPKVRDVFIFPAWVQHYVNSFKSDVERISVSGNIILKEKI
jgi:hypothetical protein